MVKVFFSNDDLQNMFVYKPTFNTLELKKTINALELKKDKRTDYVIGWKSKDLFECKLLPWHGALLPNIK